MNSRFFFLTLWSSILFWWGWGWGCVASQDQLTSSPSVQCLLVKGWKAGASWSFPRGKRNKDEEDHTCAVREVNFCLYHLPACSLISFLSAPCNFFEAYCTCSNEIYIRYHSTPFAAFIRQYSLLGLSLQIAIFISLDL